MSMKVACVAAAAVLAACSSSGAGDSQDHGPLALLQDDASGGSDSLGGTGTLRISERCVELELAGTEARRTLAWRSAQARWADDAVVFTTADSEPVTMRAGHVVTVSGEDLVGDEPVDRRARWLSPPDPSCAADVFVVHAVRLEKPG